MLIESLTMIAAVFAAWNTWRLGHFQTVSPMRKDWIAELRLNLANTMTAASHIQFLMILKENEGTPEDLERVEKLLYDLRFNAEKAVLMLNRNEKEHRELEDEIFKLFNLAMSADKSSLINQLIQVRRSAQGVIKEAWDQASKPESWIFPDPER